MSRKTELRADLHRIGCGLSLRRAENIGRAATTVRRLLHATSERKLAWRSPPVGGVPRFGLAVLRKAN